MARYGFHGGERELKFVLLYALLHAELGLTRDELTELTFIDDNMDYFQFCTALDALIDARQIAVSEGSLYRLTEEGAENAGIVGRNAPAALRRAIDTLLLPYTRRARREQRLHTETAVRGGEHYALLTLTDGRQPILRMELLAGGSEQADALCARFREEAEALHLRIRAQLEGR